MLGCAPGSEDTVQEGQASALRIVTLPCQKDSEQTCTKTVSAVMSAKHKADRQTEGDGAGGRAQRGAGSAALQPHTDRVRAGALHESITKMCACAVLPAVCFSASLGFISSLDLPSFWLP